ncbi:hypothetical protein BgAZ_205950 [Babesia gibsoni]|uniref:Uncharacterized protein n=1 Tax=Babesia gibsoni TaxID=33632 RepID=A0AAD8PE11_BABGI|nr:hypothetical protein BgAZ_205950 [Babesia gibsoni]
MASIATRRIDRMLSTPPMPLKNIAKITVTYGENNDCCRTFVKEYIPLMAYGNKHLNFVIQDADGSRQESCQVSLRTGRTVTFNFKLYRYPLQMLQRICDVASEY